MGAPPDPELRRLLAIRSTTAAMPATTPAPMRIHAHSGAPESLSEVSGVAVVESVVGVGRSEAVDGEGLVVVGEGLGLGAPVAEAAPVAETPQIGRAHV